MKHGLFLIPALVATSLFAQDPGAFAGRQGGPGDFGPRGMRGRMGMGMMGDRMGMFGMNMRGEGLGMRGRALARLLEDPMIRQQLGVTADQAAKIRQQAADFEKAEIRNRADLQVKRIELNELMSADKPDRAAIDSKIQEVGAAQLAMEKAAINNRLNMREALTPAQRQRLQQLIAQRRQTRFGGPSGFGPGAGARGPATPPPAGRGGGRGPAPTPNPPGQPAPRQ